MRARRELFARSRDLLARIAHLADELLDVVLHRIKALREVANLVRRLRHDVLRRKVTRGQLLGMAAQDFEAARDGARESEARQHDDQDAEQRQHGIREFQRRKLAEDDVLRHEQRGNPLRARHGRIGEHHGRAVFLDAQEALRLLRHLVIRFRKGRNVGRLLAVHFAVLRCDDLARVVDDVARAFAMVLHRLRFALQDVEEDVLADGAAIRARRILVRRGNRDDELARDLVDIRVHEDCLSGLLRFLVETQFRRLHLRREVAGAVADNLLVAIADDEVRNLVCILARDGEVAAQLFEALRAVILFRHDIGSRDGNLLLLSDPAVNLVGRIIHAGRDLARDGLLEVRARKIRNDKETHKKQPRVKITGLLSKCHKTVSSVSRFSASCAGSSS